MLNDRDSGHVWDIDSDQPTRLDNWDAFNLESKEKDDDEDDDREDQGDRRPPKAKRDNLGARPGRTTILHPLDNDTAPSGRLLAIRSVRDVSGADAQLAISPDGQTVQITLPNDAVGASSFEYFIDDGRQSVSAHATVRVAITGSGQANSEPRLRVGFEPRVWTVPAGGTIDVPVLSDWRDPEDGDPVSAVAAEAVAGPPGADTRITAAGAVRFIAPPQGGSAQVEYDVTDGLGEPVTETLDFRVQEPNDIEPVAPTAEPDVIAGQTGKPITITPLANDLPGSDPLTPDAVLTLAGEVGNVPGADVTTNVVKGTITLRSETAQTYFLEYQAAYGTADTDTGKIRVDVRAPENPPVKPVAVPDTVTLFGQAGSLVDVLANDVDPSGGLLSVQRAEPLSANQLDVAVVDGRWLRVSARQGQLSPNPQIIRYTITNGRQSGIAGQVVVSQRPPPADDTPVTQNDEVTVREGSSQAISVLDNDFSPSGGTLTLVSGSGAGTEAGAGRLDVEPVGSHTGDTGAAFVSGRTVRYVAPSAVPGPQRFTIRYQAANEQGDTATGKLRVWVRPIRLRNNNPPEPPVIEGRTVSGDTVKLRLPGYGVDPDGDPVTILGLDSAPELGQVVRIGANSIDYTAYPNSEGTDEFTYRITDSLGARSTGTVRVSIAPPGPPQPPLAVADSITVAPGRTAVVDVLANDLVAAGSRVTVSLVAPPAGVRLRSDTGPIEMDAPDQVDGRSIEVVYRLTDGLESSQTTVTLRTQAGYNNPPVVSDAFGAVGDGRSVTADVLTAGSTDDAGSTSGAYDPDGPFEDLVVADVYAPPGIATRIEGGRVTVERAEQPMVVPFRVEDARWRRRHRLSLRAGGRLRPAVRRPRRPDHAQARQEARHRPGRLRHQPVRRTGRVHPEEPDLGLSTHQARRDGHRRRRLPGLRRRLVLRPGRGRLRGHHGDLGRRPRRRQGDLVGAGAGGRDPAHPALSRGPHRRATGRVGADRRRRPVPRLDRRPGAGRPALLVRGLRRRLRPRADRGHLRRRRRRGEGLVGDPARPDRLPCGSRPTTACPAGSGSGSCARRRRRWRRSGSPRSRRASRRPSTSRRYLTPEVSAPEPTVVNAAQLSDLPVQIDSSGSSVTIRAGAKAHGRAVFRVVMSDVANSAGPDRRVEGRITLDILGVPDVPGVPVPGKRPLKAKVELDWRAPQSNGAPDRLLRGA